MKRWQAYRDPVATLVFGFLTLAVGTDAIPETVDRNLILGLIGAVMTIAAGLTTVTAPKNAGANDTKNC